MRFVRYPSMDKRHHLAFMLSPSDPRNLQFAYISADTWDKLKYPQAIAVINAKDDIPDTWYSVWKGVGGARWMEIAVVDSLQTAQALLNTMQTGRITHDDVQIEVKNPHLNDH
jgi:hypothetical protein